MKTLITRRKFVEAVAVASIAIALLTASPTRGDDRAMAELLQKSGVEVKLDPGGHAISVACREATGLKPEDFCAIGQLRRLETLSIGRAQCLTDDKLALLKDLDEVQRVTFESARLTDEGFRHMAGWKGLRQLTFYHLINPGKFTGAGLAHLAALPNLEKFACGGSSFTDAGMQACSNLTRLTDLRIWHTPATDAGVAYLAKLPALRNLKLGAQWTPRITDAALPQLAAIKTLESLSLGETRLTWDGGLRHLKALPNLKKLELDQIELSEADLAQLKSELPGVQVSWRPVEEKYREQLRKNWEKKAGSPR
jgi:hypothetical protein